MARTGGRWAQGRGRARAESAVGAVPPAGHYACTQRWRHLKPLALCGRSCAKDRSLMVGGRVKGTGRTHHSTSSRSGLQRAPRSGSAAPQAQESVMTGHESLNPSFDVGLSAPAGSTWTRVITAGCKGVLSRSGSSRGRISSGFAIAWPAEWNAWNTLAAGAHALLTRRLPTPNGSRPERQTSQKYTFQNNGDPGRTRTCDPLLRRQMLYPAELRDRARCLAHSPMPFTLRAA